jgi:hypothetical protein
VRENERWATVPDQVAEINNLKLFLWNRIAWINSNIGSFAGCNTVVVPALVITKINYNPLGATSTESDNLEFVEIKNTATTTVNLTGFYFKELGMTYQFPANSSVLAGESIFLTSNSTAFQTKYGLSAFGQFTRNLSNSSQKIVLADGFGNTIDSVEYLDASPWPIEADGTGSYLQLISTSLDNNLASNWIASTNNNLSTSTSTLESSIISIYPNPVTHFLNIQANEPMSGIKIFDASGKLIYDLKQKSNTLNTDWSKFSNGIYFVVIYTEKGFTTKKVIKQ